MSVLSSICEAAYSVALSVTFRYGKCQGVGEGGTGGYRTGFHGCDLECLELCQNTNYTIL